MLFIFIPKINKFKKSDIEFFQRVGNPIVRIDAVHIGGGRKSSSNQSNRLESKLFLCKGYFVLFTKNVCKVLEFAMVQQ